MLLVAADPLFPDVLAERRYPGVPERLVEADSPTLTVARLEHEPRQPALCCYRTAAQVNDPISDSDRFLFPNSGRELVLVKKGAAAVNVTVETGATFDGLALAERTVAVAANTDRVLGPFKPGIYNDSDGKVALQFDAAAAISVAVIRT